MFVNKSKTSEIKDIQVDRANVWHVEQKLSWRWWLAIVLVELSLGRRPSFTVRIRWESL